MLRTRLTFWGLLLLSIAACSSPDPDVLAFAAARAGHPGATGSKGAADAGAGAADTPPSAPPSIPPPIVATDASAGGGGPAADAAPPAAPSGSCATPKCGANADGCGCAASNGQGDVVFLGCNGQGCVCGHGQTVDQQLNVTNGCDSDADLLAAWQMCTCP
jgi:hypothetical protein